MKEKTMGNSPSLKSHYMELVKGLLHSIGIKTSTRHLSELFCLIEQHCYWFQYQTKVQLNLKEWKVIQKELRRQHQKGNVIPLKLWTLCSAITQALKLMAADSEAVSCSLKKDDPLYEDVPVSEEKEGECRGRFTSASAQTSGC